MPAMDYESTRLALVSSLYGPGTFGAWILTFIGVAISWTFNLRSRQKDSITNDFIAVLALPAIASVHVLSQLPRNPSAVQILFTSHELHWLQESAAIEAPLAICETFLSSSLIFLSISASWGHKKRSLLVLVVSIMTCLCELVLYAQTKVIQALRFNTTRTFLFQIHWAILLFSATLLIGATTYIVKISLAWLASEDNDLDLRKQRLRRWIRRSFPALLVASGPLIVIHSQQTLYAPIRDHPPSPPSYSPFIAPRTTSSIGDLDQAVALGIGAITLAFSIHDAFKSRRKARFRSNSIEDREQKALVKSRTASGGLKDENISTLVLDTDYAKAPDRNELGTLTRPDASYMASKYPQKRSQGEGS